MTALGAAVNQDRPIGEHLTMEESDAAFIAASLEEPGYFGVLFDRYGSLLLRFLARRVDPAEAEGLLGDVFRIAFERRASFDLHRACARPWLYGIAANVVSKHRRAEARRLRATLRLAALRRPTEDPAEQAVRSADAQARWVQLVDGITALPDGERQALLLFAWEELSYEEIAEALGIPTGTVRSRLHRARARLADPFHQEKPGHQEEPGHDEEPGGTAPVAEGAAR